jgi:hypothetical protein
MREMNFMGRKVVVDIKNWGDKLLITIHRGFNVSELNTIKEEIEEWLKILGCGGGSVEIHVRETAHRLTIIVTPPKHEK